MKISLDFMYNENDYEQLVAELKSKGIKVVASDHTLPMVDVELTLKSTRYQLSNYLVESYGEMPETVDQFIDQYKED